MDRWMEEWMDGWTGKRKGFDGSSGESLTFNLSWKAP